jgi:hypothetical protein
LRAEPGSDLPAPWRNPWSLLGEDLRAVLAWQGLKLRELLRRNRQGDLWRPPFWPADRAALFWPAVTALLAVLLIGMPLLLAPAAPEAPRTAAPAPPDSLAAVPSPPAMDAPAPASASPASSPSFASPLPSPASAAPSATPAERVAAAIAEPPASLESAPAPASAPVDPLLSALDAGSASLLRAVEAQPARSWLTLEVEEAFGRLDPTQREQRLRVWQERGRSLGYEHLEVLDGSGRRLARSALVGSGMILLDAPPVP